MQSCLERARQLHEDLTSLEIASAKCLEYKDQQGPRVKALKRRGLYVPTDARFDHAANLCADKIMELYAELHAFYSDKDRSRREYIKYLGGLMCADRSGTELTMDDETLEGTDPHNVVVLRFYDRLKQLKESYSNTNTANLPQGTAQLSEVYAPAKHFEKLVLMETMDATELVAKEMPISGAASLLITSRAKGLSCFFTANEKGGTILDMDRLYHLWCNMPKYRMYKEKTHRMETELRIKRQHAQKLQKLQSAAAEAAREDGEGEIPKIEIEELDWNNPVIKRRLIFQGPDLVGYLRSFDDFSRIPRWCKYGVKEYEEYITTLRDYLWSFLARRNPMKDLSDIEFTMAEDFQSRFQSRSIAGWHTFTHEDPYYALPTDMLFSALPSYEGHLKSKKCLKAAEKQSKMTREELDELKKKSEKKDEHLAWFEIQIQRLKDILDEPLTSTIEDLQKRQSRTQEDLEANENDFSDESPPNDGDGEELSSENSDDKLVYNPLNLPLGFDGRPIPYWLYKLHGLGTEFKCEICGNYSYWGRRAFDKHFSEWRHAFGMRCLKIPNTPHFREITSIQDALKLYERLLRESQLNAFNPEDEMEVEDEQGNVMSLKDFRARKGETAKF
eukprot:GHVH01004405.1.p1 GENE.GHVH01004405.1~~GHVH01004405.1.p1  ORF type:complete len:617 (-),score=91.40 GHVH01004405.1:1018-2868(-)